MNLYIPVYIFFIIDFSFFKIIKFLMFFEKKKKLIYIIKKNINNFIINYY